MWKMSIQYPVSNSQPSDYESPPLTTRPGLLPNGKHLFNAIFSVKLRSHDLLSFYLQLSGFSGVNKDCLISSLIGWDFSCFTKYKKQIFFLWKNPILSYLLVHFLNSESSYKFNEEEINDALLYRPKPQSTQFVTIERLRIQRKYFYNFHEKEFTTFSLESTCSCKGKLKPQNHWYFYPRKHISVACMGLTSGAW